MLSLSSRKHATRRFAATARSDAEQVYRAAQSAQPVCALAADRRSGRDCGRATAVIAANYMPTVGGIRLPADLGKLVIKGTKVTMQQPRLNGFTRRFPSV